MHFSIQRRSAAEFAGTLFLLMAVVGSGIMGERLAKGNDAVALLANSVATGTALIFLILCFGEISGAHFNPLVTLSEFARRRIGLGETVIYLLFQTTGAFAGTALANFIFGLPFFTASVKIRSGKELFVSEFIASFGLLMVIQTCSKFHKEKIPFAVACYITSAYWFTSSTSFANPAVTLARTLTDTFSGIRFSDAPLFIIAQIAGAFAATFFFSFLDSDKRNENQSNGNS